MKPEDDASTAPVCWRLRADKGVRHCLHKIAGEAGRQAGYTGECGGTGTILDAVADNWMGGSEQVWQGGSAWASRPNGGTRPSVCLSRVTGIKLRNRTDVRCFRRGKIPLTQLTRSEAERPASFQDQDSLFMQDRLRTNLIIP